MQITSWHRIYSAPITIFCRRSFGGRSAINHARTTQTVVEIVTSTEVPWRASFIKRRNLTFSITALDNSAAPLTSVDARSTCSYRESVTHNHNTSIISDVCSSFSARRRPPLLFIITTMYFETVKRLHRSRVLFLPKAKDELHPSSPLPLEVGPLTTARGVEERCKLPQWGLGRSPS